MTIFLTTQYLEEADALADRVGIIDEGKLVAEGTPEELKRNVGQDVIIVRIDGDGEVASASIRQVPGVSAVEQRHDELVVSVDEGAATIGPVAVVLADTAAVLRYITLRTPTLDDVFLQLTGNRIATGAASRADEPAPSTVTRPDVATDDESESTPEPVEALR